MNWKKLAVVLVAVCGCLSAFQGAEASVAVTENRAAPASIAVTGNRATPAYWLSRTMEADKVLLTPAQINDQNEDMALRDTTLPDLAAFPESLSGTEVRQRIMAAMQDYWTDTLPKEYVGMDILTLKQWQQVRANCNIVALPKTVACQYAVTVNRLNMRLLPTLMGWYEEPGDVNYDDLQATVLDPAEPVVVLHRSRDGKFVFVQAEDYQGWVRDSQLAYCNREDWLRYVSPDRVAVVTVSRKYIDAGDSIQLYQLGATIPVGKVQGKTGKRATAKRGLLLPARDSQGRLVIKNVPAEYDDTLHDGYLPCTRANFIRMAFKCLGDEYGWGGQNDSVDCSSFVQDVYHTMGLRIPRDADHQELALLKQVKLEGLDTAARYRQVKQKAEPGDLLFKPGHVMMYLGRDEKGTPMVIHSASSYFTFEGGKKKKHYIRQVLVSDLTYQNGARVQTIDGLTSMAGLWH